MEPQQAGITALVTAYSRAYHVTHDSPIIFNDFLAEQFFTPQERDFFDKQLGTSLKLIDPDLAARNPDPASALAFVIQLQTGPITLSRSRYCEDELDKAIEDGVEQYVILGAGFDTFAFRRPELAAHLQIFEVDHPVTQGLKQQKIAAVNWEYPNHLHFVPVDFSTDKLMSALISAGFNPKKKAFFSWLGVTFYLANQSIADTLQVLANIGTSGSILIFDYIDTDGFIAERAGRAAQLMQHFARQSGEPMLTCFNPEELGEYLQRYGFRLSENLSPEDIEARYFQGRQDLYHAFPNIHISRSLIE